LPLTSSSIISFGFLASDSTGEVQG
jgi:hypothetical protein